VATGCVGVCLDADWRRTIDHGQDAVAAVSDGDQDIEGVSARADLRNGLHRVHDVHREALAQHDHERVTGADRESIHCGAGCEFLVVS
jgi:hypothetical protein